MRLKRLERAWKRVWIRALSATLAAGGKPEPPRWGERPYRVLFLRHDRIGDMILSTGLIRAIGGSHPDLALDVLASPANAPILWNNPHVSRIVVVDLGKPAGYLDAARRLRANRYDAVIDCMVTAPSLTTLLLMAASGARHRIGIAGRGIDAALTVPVPARPGAVHMVERLSALAAPFGVDPEAADFHPEIHLTAGERTEAERRWAEVGGPDAARLLVNVSAGKAKRHWPDERFVAVLREVRRLRPGRSVLVVGAPREQERMERIAAEGGGMAAPTPGVRDALALVSTADHLFTPDTSLAHAASAFHVPAVVMYLRGVPDEWRLYGTPGRNLESPDGLLDSLPLDAVLPAVLDLLADPGAPRTAP